ncbi:MAG TPA: MSMEG_0570 family nitrogen starvation response protein, partial [Desulfurivibrionaceae bacterium]|nr:MSMEG_0570 family nitrogen starvation response protein [Desulfurivibrionaceae bacterium]
MPSVNFRIVWPDGDVGVYYSPSTVVHEHLRSGSYPQDQFLRLCTTALNAATERVRERFGFACTAAQGELEKITDKLTQLSQGHIQGPVQLAGIEPDGAVPASGTPPHYSALVIGAGQAGLAMSYCLQDQGIDHLVLEASGEIAHAWRHERWDSFCLVTPNWQCQLPGFPYQGDDPHGFMVKDEIIGYLEDYYAFFKPPVVFHSPVTELTRAHGRYQLRSGERRFTCDQVIVCCGGYHEPRIPAAAEQLPDTIEQLHSRDYRNHQQLPEGDILVVGSAQSGSQIAED